MCATFSLAAQRLVADGISYTVDESGRATVVLGDDYYTGKVSIPAVLGGKQVASVGFGAFNACHGLTGVMLPNGIATIGDYAFNACDSLTAITIPETVTGIGAFAFHGCSRIVDIVIPEAVTSIGVFRLHSVENSENRKKCDQHWQTSLSAMHPTENGDR